jgi:hypothetical protein
MRGKKNSFKEANELEETWRTTASNSFTNRMPRIYILPTALQQQKLLCCC